VHTWDGKEHAAEMAWPYGSMHYIAMHYIALHMRISEYKILFCDTNTSNSHIHTEYFEHKYMYVRMIVDDVFFSLNSNHVFLGLVNLFCHANVLIILFYYIRCLGSKIEGNSY